MDAAPVATKNEEYIKQRKEPPEPLNERDGEVSQQDHLREVGNIPLEVGDPNLR